MKYTFPTDFPIFAKDLVKKILHPLPEKRLSIENILKHKWFEQNKVNLSSITKSPQKSLDSSNDSTNFDFKEYVQERIAESIMPDSHAFSTAKNDFKTSGMSKMSPTATDSKSISKGKMVNSTQFSFTPDELAQVIRP